MTLIDVSHTVEPELGRAHPLLTLPVMSAMRAAHAQGQKWLSCSVDLQRTITTVEPGESDWTWADQAYPYPEKCKERTVYHWDGANFQPVARFSGSLIKLVPTDWGPPTFEIDGIKMLPTLHLSPYADAVAKVALIQPRGKSVLDTCGGLGYFAAACLNQGAAQVASFEKNPDVIWLRGLNPWSPPPEERLALTQGDILRHIEQMPAASYDAALHDPPRFGIAGDLYSQSFYDQLLRVLKPRGRLFHYTGSPNKLTSKRDVPSEVLGRLGRAGFNARIHGDGILAFKP